MQRRRTSRWLAGRALVAVVTVVALLATTARTVLADSARRVSFQVSYTVKSPYYSRLCGFDVLFSLSGTFSTMMTFNTTGAVSSEIDTQPGTYETFSAPASGRSFSFPFADILRTDYPGGASPGSPAVAYGTGLAGNVPGLPADAGTVTFGQATVLAILPGGVPLVDLGPVTATTGHANDPTAIDNAICAALTP